jgi:hypothetical protein
MAPAGAVQFAQNTSNVRGATQGGRQRQHVSLVPVVQGFSLAGTE